VKQVLDAKENLKHKAILTTIYSCGLRLSEVLELQISDIKTKDHLLLIRQSKGNKDRFLRLNPTFWGLAEDGNFSKKSSIKNPNLKP
jgi:site-specific recombinase XerD